MAFIEDLKPLKIYVGGLSLDTTKESLDAYFSQYGHVDSYVMKDGVTGRSRGFGFVNFSDASTMNAVLTLQHQIEGVNVRCLPYGYNKGKGGGGGKGRDFGPEGPRTNASPELKLFIGGLSQETTKESMNAHFQQFGPVDCYVMKDGSTGRSRGFGFANFQDHVTLSTVLGAEHQVDGVMVTVSPYAYRGKGGGLGGGGPPPQVHHHVPVQAAPAVLPIQAVDHTSGALSNLSTQMQTLLLMMQQLQPQQQQQQQQLQLANQQQRLLEQQQEQEQLQFLAQQRQQQAQRAQQAQQAQQQLEQQQIGQLLDQQQLEEMERDLQQPPSISVGENPLKIFVGGLSQETSKESLTLYFSQYGYADGYVMKDGATGRSRGFGFVSFQDEQVVNTILQLSHQIDGVLVTVSPYKGPGRGGGHSSAHLPPASPVLAQLPGQDLGLQQSPLPQQDLGMQFSSSPPVDDLGMDISSSLAASAPKPSARQEPDLGANGRSEPTGTSTKVFVANLPSGITDDSIMSAYQIFQPISCIVMRDASGRSAIVEFGTPSIAQLAIRTPPTIDGITLEVSEHQDSRRGATPPGGASRAAPY